MKRDREITGYLNKMVKDGDDLNMAFNMVYADLRGMARTVMSGERKNHTLSPTALVHEIWLRISKNPFQWENRAKFFRLARNVMDHVVRDYGKMRNAEKRPFKHMVEVSDFVKENQMDRKAENMTRAYYLLEGIKHLEKKDPLGAKAIWWYYLGVEKKVIALELGLGEKALRGRFSCAVAAMNRILCGEEHGRPKNSSSK